MKTTTQTPEQIIKIIGQMSATIMVWTAILAMIPRSGHVIDAALFGVSLDIVRIASMGRGVMAKVNRDPPPPLAPTTALQDRHQAALPAC
jgi:hypothetical protein